MKTPDVDKYENPSCQDCGKLEAKALKKGRNPREAICAACRHLRDNVTDPPIGARSDGHGGYMTGGGLTMSRVGL
jgi:hypothetical protein